jgi:hypothetical protein
MVIGRRSMLCANKAYACGTLNLCFALSSWTLCVGFVVTGSSDESGVAIEGVWVKVTSSARYGVSSSVFEWLVFGCSWIPMSAGRSVENVGIIFGGSNWTSVIVEEILAKGAILERMW